MGFCIHAGADINKVLTVANMLRDAAKVAHSFDLWVNGSPAGMDWVRVAKYLENYAKQKEAEK